ncbi:MAG: cysteine desulfurase, partial [Parcubacteria group bacterium]|nr:cysteine desulfurase [Parcubacteria group bacterium]
HLITTATEHVSVLNVFKELEKWGFEVTYLPVDEFGRVTADQVIKAIRTETILVSVIFASNEIGTINPIKDIGRAIVQNRALHNKGFPYFHTDAAQAFPHLKINADNLSIDLMSFSSNKMYGPKGAAALYIKHGVKIEPVMLGGSQENGWRPGTQDVSGIVGFAEAVKINQAEGFTEDEQLKLWCDKIIKEVQSALPDVLLNGPPPQKATEGRSHPQERLANNISFAIPSVKAEELVAAMDLAGFAISTRSACDAKNPTPPHVIKAIGRSDEAAWGTVRVTLGRFTTVGDIDQFIGTFINEIKKLNINTQMNRR